MIINNRLVAFIVGVFILLSKGIFAEDSRSGTILSTLVKIEGDISEKDGLQSLDISTGRSDDSFLNYGIGDYVQSSSKKLISSDKCNPIALDVKNMEVADIFKMLSMNSNLSIVLDNKVRGKVTLFLKDVCAKDALDIVLAAADLACKKEGEILYVMPKAEYEKKYGTAYSEKRITRTFVLQNIKAASVAAMLRPLKSQSGNIVTNNESNMIILFDVPENIDKMESIIQQMDRPIITSIIMPNYAKAEDILDTVKSNLTPNIGDIQIDSRTNKLIVSDYPEVIEKIKKIVSALDEKQRQVLIEAKIVEVTLNDEMGFGIDWEVFASKDLHITGGVASSVDSTLSFETATLSEKGDYSAILTALKKLGNTKILSSPRILVSNNQEAKILVGTKEAYATKTVVQNNSTSSTAESVNFVDVGVKLYVTPTITRDGFISMKIRPEVSSVTQYYETAEGEKIPIVDTSQVETAVEVKDGITVILAGLIKDEKDDLTQGFPVISRIPILGHLFKSTYKKTLKKELVIFITPKIVSGEKTMY